MVNASFPLCKTSPLHSSVNSQESLSASRPDSYSIFKQISRSVSLRLNSAAVIMPVFVLVFFQSASPSDLRSCSPLKSSESNTNSSLLVRRLNVKSSILVSSAPIISGERNIHHSVIMVFCSSLVNRQSLSPVSKPLPTLPSGSISQSGKQPSFT